MATRSPRTRLPAPARRSRTRHLQTRLPRSEAETEDAAPADEGCRGDDGAGPADEPEAEARRRRGARRRGRCRGAGGRARGRGDLVTSLGAPRSGDPSGRGRDHRGHRRGEVDRARSVSRARRGDGLERRDRPSPARSGRRGPRRDRRTARPGGARRGRSTRPFAHRRRRSSATRSDSHGSRGCSIRSSRASTSRGASSWRRSTTLPASALPRCRFSRSRRGGELRQGRRDHRSHGAPGAAPPSRRATTATRGCCPTARRSGSADFHYVNTGTFEDLFTWVGGVMAELEAEAGASP